MNKYGNCTIICTDANIHSTLAGYSTSDKRAKEVELFTIQNNLTCKNIPSREIHTHNSTKGTKTTVDYTFCSFNLDDNIIGWNTDENIEILSDHVPITFQLGFNPSLATFSKKPNFYKTNFKNLNEFLSNELKNDELEDLPLPDDIWETFENSVNRAIDKFVPKKKPKVRQNLWWNEKLESMRKNLKRIQRYEKQNYKKAKLEYSMAINEAKRNSFEKFISESSCENDWFFKSKIFLLNKKQESHPTIKLPSGNMCENTLESYKYLLDSNFPNLPLRLSSFQSSVERFVQQELNKPTPNDVPKITETEVQTAIHAAPSNKAPGLDEIETIFYKKATPAILEPMTLLFNQIIETGEYPAKWKQSKVAFLKKPDKPDYTLPNSYRPISLLPDASKIFERVLNLRLKYHVNTQGMINKLQFGFRSGIAAEQSAFKLANDIFTGFKTNKDTLAVFLDVKNAFPSVWSNGLIFKLLQTNLPKPYTRVLHSYLTNRSAAVLIDENNATHKKLNRGIPQGSVLSPLLWNLFANELFQIAERKGVQMISYADDTVLYITSDQDIKKTEEKLNSTINLFHTWSQKWMIEFSTAKTKAVLFSRKYKQGDKYKPQLTMNKDKIELVTEFTYLGIIFDSKLNWKTHIKTKISNSIPDINKYRALCRKHFGLPAISTKLLIERVITPRLTYGAIVWSPALNLNYNHKTLKQFDRAAGLAITTCYKTSGTDALLIICGLMPIKLKLEKIIISSMFNTLSSDRLTTVLEIDKIYSIHKEYKAYQSPLQMALMLLSKTETVINGTGTLNYSNLEKQVDKSNLPHPAILTNSHITHKTKREAIDFEANDESHVKVYTDAGYKAETNIGYAIVVAVNGETHRIIRGSLPPSDSVFHGELTAVKLAIKFVTEGNLQNCAIFSDSHAVVSAMSSRSVSDRLVVDTRHELLVAHENLNCKLHWIPGHSNIKFNELAHKEAQISSNISPPPQLTTKTELIRKTQQRLIKEWENEWVDCGNCRRTFNIFKKPNLKPLIVSSKVLTYKERRLLFNAASGHFPNKSHLFRINKAESGDCGHCGTPETIEHLIKDCPLALIGEITNEETNLADYSLEVIFNNELKLKKAASILEKYLKRENLPYWRNN